MRTSRPLQSILGLPLLLLGVGLSGQTRNVSFNVVCVANPAAKEITHRKACVTDPPALTFDSEVTLAVEHDEENSFDDIEDPNPTSLILFLDGKALPGTHPAVGLSESDEDDVTTTLLTYRISRDLNTDQARKNWKEVLAAANSGRPMVISTGLVDGPAAQSRANPVEFQTIRASRVAIWIVLAIAGIVIFLFIAVKTFVLRDKEDYPDAVLSGAKKPAYSLSRVQMAIWTMLVVYAYLLIWVLTGEYKATIPGSAITLMGITAATFAGAAVVDATKLGENKEKAQKVATNSEQEKQIRSAEANTTVCESEGFFRDISTGANGASLHRLQFIVWTLALMVIFVFTVWRTLAMPDFDTTLLSLMGISSGTYVGLKLPETKC